MNNGLLNSDFIDFLNALNNHAVEYIIVGGYAVIIHGYSRTTGDLDIWINPTELNYSRLLESFLEFKMPLMGMTKDKFLDTENYEVFSFGRPPVSLDLMTSVKGLSFQESFNKANKRLIDGVEIFLIDYRDLLSAKKASARFKDLDDIENLRKTNNKPEI